jgi:hypothetical protein
LTLTIEKTDGKVRQVEFVENEKVGIARVILTFKPKKGEKIVCFDCQIVETLI